MQEDTVGDFMLKKRKGIGKKYKRVHSYKIVRTLNSKN